MGKAKFINQKQYTLLVNSDIYNQVSNDYPWLEEFFSSISGLTKKQVEQLPAEERSFFENNFSKIIILLKKSVAVKMKFSLTVNLPQPSILLVRPEDFEPSTY